MSHREVSASGIEYGPVGSNRCRVLLLTRKQYPLAGKAPPLSFVPRRARLRSHDFNPVGQKSGASCAPSFAG